MNLQQTILQALQSENPDSQLGVNDVFSNYRNDKGLCLTKLGLDLMQKAFDSYMIELRVDSVKPWHRLTLERELALPYYIHSKKHKVNNFTLSNHYMVMFSEIDYMELKLYDGDLDKWCKARNI